MREERARRQYRWLLLLSPRGLRAKHGEEMEDLFLLRWRETAPGLVGGLSLWGHAAADVLSAWSRAHHPLTEEDVQPGSTPARRTAMTLSDVRSAFRSLVRQKSATALVVTMLALGIAANVAVFGLINGLFLRPFPFPAPDRLVYVNETAPRWNLEVVGINYPDFDHWRKEQRLFESLTFYDSVSFNLSDGANADRISGGKVTHEFPAVLGVSPLLGRFFSAEEDRKDGPPVLVLGHALWQERFGGDRDVLGQTLRLDGVARTIVGVMPPQATFPGDARLWVPLAANPNQEGQSYYGEALGRLKPGVDATQAEADLLRTQQAIWDARDKDKIVSPFVRPLREEYVKDFRAAASALAGAVGLLLLVACANVASLMLARALARRREMAVRVAVGASGLRLLSQLLIENVMLAAVGGAVGLLGGYWALRALVRAIPDEVPRWAVFALDTRVMVFALAISGITVVLFGWAPALHALRDDLRSAMSTVASGTTASPRGRRTLRLLVGAEFALAALLLICGGLLLQAMGRVRTVAPGFEPKGVLTFGVYLPRANYPDNAKRLAFWDGLLERLQALPGVDSAGAITCAPLGCHWGNFFEAEGQPPRDAGQANPVVLWRFATPSYFRTLGVRLKAGRLLEDSDGRGNTAKVVVVNEAFAREFLPGVSEVVGHRIRRAGNTEDPWTTVVGLVGDVKHYGLERPMRPGLYLPLPDEPPDTLTIALKTGGDPLALVGPARAILRERDPDLALYQVRTMEEALRRSHTTRATYSWMLAVFALLALVLALGGAYGVTAYLATQRTREIGIRLALGAQKADIRRAVLRGNLAVAGAGIGLGIVASLGAARLLSSLLFGVPGHDPTALGGAVAVLGAAALFANWIPAARAAQANPMATLRAD